MHLIATFKKNIPLREAQISAKNEPSTCRGILKIQNNFFQLSLQLLNFGAVKKSFNKPLPWNQLANQNIWFSIDDLLKRA